MSSELRSFPETGRLDTFFRSVEYDCFYDGRLAAAVRTYEVCSRRDIPCGVELESMIARHHHAVEDILLYLARNIDEIEIDLRWRVVVEGERSPASERIRTDSHGFVR